MVHTYTYTLLCIEFNIISVTLSQCPDLLKKGAVGRDKIVEHLCSRAGPW